VFHIAVGALGDHDVGVRPGGRACNETLVVGVEVGGVQQSGLTIVDEHVRTAGDVPGAVEGHLVPGGLEGLAVAAGGVQ
jgi:hypothetical protein